MISTDYKQNLPSGEDKVVNLHIGQMLRLRSTITEGSKTRVQAYEGMLIAMRGRGENRSIVVRRITPGGVGVERIWPLNSPAIVDITITRQPTKVRRSKLYFLRGVQGKAASRI